MSPLIRRLSSNVARVNQMTKSGMPGTIATHVPSTFAMIVGVTTENLKKCGTIRLSMAQRYRNIV